MANQRIYLVCDHCKDSLPFMLAKRMATGFYNTPTAEDFFKFLNDHEFCNSTLDHFSIEYEMERDWDVKKPETA